MPCALRLGDIDNIEQDIANLCKTCQWHECSSYCMRKKSKSKSKCRECRSGFGKEDSPNSCNTPGLTLRTEPIICKENRDYFTLHMERNNVRMYQTSTFCIQGWRANCDFKILLYNTSFNNNNPSPEEISRIVDYIVAYSCKGNLTTEEEKNVIKDFILQQKTSLGTQQELVTLVRQILNRSVGSRIIPKQECMVEVSMINLILCSETIDDISLSGIYALKQKPKKTAAQKKSLLDQYRDFSKQTGTMSLYDFYHERYNNNGLKKVPHFSGGNSQPTYPVTKEYARMTLIIHKPWVDGYPVTNNIYADDQLIDLFEKFIKDKDCPNCVQLTYQRVYTNYIRKLKEPTVKQDFSTISDITHSNLPQDVVDTVLLCSTHQMPPDLDCLHNFDTGTSYDWYNNHDKVSYCHQ